MQLVKEGINNKTLNTLRDKFSALEGPLTFSTTSVFIHIFSIFRVLNLIPSWIKWMDSIFLFGTISYFFVGALVESLILTLFFMGLRKLIQIDWVQKNYLILIIVFFISILGGWRLYSSFEPNMVGRLRLMSGLLISFTSLSILFSEYKYIRNFMLNLIDRATVLAWLFLFFDLIGLTTVILRILFSIFRIYFL